MPGSGQRVADHASRPVGAAAAVAAGVPAARCAQRCGGERPAWRRARGAAEGRADDFGKALHGAGFLGAETCRAAGLSERYVNELLYEAGASFTMRLLELRLRKAAELLAQPTERRISDIAFACGFNDLSYFNRCFRSRFGLTPAAARGR
jgi:AraC-like DNA-binding protein